MQELPSELIIHISTFIRPIDVISLSRSAKIFHYVVDSHIILNRISTEIRRRTAVLPEIFEGYSVTWCDLLAVLFDVETSDIFNILPYTVVDALKNNTRMEILYSKVVGDYQLISTHYYASGTDENDTYQGYTYYQNCGAGSHMLDIPLFHMRQDTEELTAFTKFKFEENCQMLQFSCGYFQIDDIISKKIPKEIGIPWGVTTSDTLRGFFYNVCNDAHWVFKILGFTV
jgi:hypothetical protein